MGQMTLLSTIKQNEQNRDAIEAKNILTSLIQADQYVGDVYSIGYEFANVQIHDFYKKNVGGIPSLCFLIATRIKVDAEQIDYQREDSSAILLRVMDATPLPGHSEAERVRVETAQKVSGETSVNWDESQIMDATTANLLSFAGIKCRVIGTFFVDKSERLGQLVLKFGSDLSNYYPNQGLKVYKPNQESLSKIVNYIDPDRIDPDQAQERVMVGDVRYASTNRSFQGISSVQVYISPADLLGQKTALFGMTRSGKSNTTKIILKSVFEMRFAKEKPLRIGQIVFDPNGEYANENEQDKNQEKNPSAIKNVWKVNPTGIQDDVVTYGLLRHPNDPRRKLMLLNFYRLENLQQGKEIIDSALADDTSKYIQNFIQVSFDEPDPKDNSATTRYKRLVLIYHALLKRAGFQPSPNSMPTTTRLFNKKLLEYMIKAAKTGQKDAQPEFESAAAILATEHPTWDQLAIAVEALHKFMSTAEYKEFEHWYINKRNKASQIKQVDNTDDADNETDEGEKWADAKLEKILKMFEYANGPRLVARVIGQHSNSVKTDYADDIYKDLVDGKLVIVDQSSGDEEINRASASRILTKIFRKNQTKFRDGEATIPEILVYVEEAHNLLPSGSETDLKNIWVRTAKEASKYHIGLVYATQEVSSIQRNILKNTANWFIGHLNNTDETKELCKYYDFADFEPSIRRAQDRGFLRIKTLSNMFVVPAQIKKFEV